ncbi:MAG: hypothetical protein V5A22_12115 [Salinivenus sp.]
MPDDRSFDDPRPPTEEEWGTPLVEPRSAPTLEEPIVIHAVRGGSAD